MCFKYYCIFRPEWMELSAALTSCYNSTCCCYCCMNETCYELSLALVYSFSLYISITMSLCSKVFWPRWFVKCCGSLLQRTVALTYHKLTLCDFSNDVTFGHNKIWWPSAPDSLSNSFLMLQSSATTNWWPKRRKLFKELSNLIRLSHPAPLSADDA